MSRWDDLHWDGLYRCEDHPAGTHPTIEEASACIHGEAMTNPAPTPHPPNDLAAPGDLVAEDGSIYMAAPAPQPCGCSCACHNKTHTGYQNVKCQNKADWLPEYKVWACQECLVTCDD